MPESATSESLLALKSILLESIADGIIAHTLDGHIVYANTRAAEMLGLTLEELTGSGPYGWVDRDNDDHDFELRLDRIRTPGGYVFESPRQLGDGTTVCIEVHSRAVRVPPWGELIVSVSRDTTARAAAQETMRRLAFHDGLTGLSNRLMLQDRVDAALMAAKAHGQMVGIVYMDLDDFKPVNDTHGHHVGDRVLCVVGERLQHCVRDTDTIARVGGDEFIALFPRIADGFDLSAKAKALAECASEPMSIDGATLRVTMSVGLATYECDEPIDELIRRADHAMYHAKMHGRAGWEEFPVSA